LKTYIFLDFFWNCWYCWFGKKNINGNCKAHLYYVLF